MSSHLRIQSSFEEPISTGVYQTSPTLPPAKKQKMSLTQTYYVASTARTKLGREAGKPDHNLRLLVGHANLLDFLMVELADAEREQEAWFNNSVQKASTAPPAQPSHISFALDEDMEDDDSDMSDDDSDIYDEDDDVLFNLPLRKIRSPPIELFFREMDEDPDYTDDDEDLDDDEDSGDLSLQRVTSQHSPPELTLDSDESESDDDSMPSSPEQSAFDITDKQREVITTTSFYTMDAVMQAQRQQPMIAAC